MNIEVKNSEGNEDNDYQSSIEISIDEGVAFSVHDGESEDNNLSRNFSACYKIASLLEKAWRAGVNGEDFNIKYIFENENETNLGENDEI